VVAYACDLYNGSISGAGGGFNSSGLPTLVDSLLNATGNGGSEQQLLLDALNQLALQLDKAQSQMPGGMSSVGLSVFQATHGTCQNLNPCPAGQTESWACASKSSRRASAHLSLFKHRIFLSLFHARSAHAGYFCPTPSTLNPCPSGSFCAQGVVQ
jgi:hypothetical protein